MIEGKQTRFSEQAFEWLCLAAIVLPLLMLVVLVGDVLITGFPRLNADFLTSYPSRKPELAGILSAGLCTLLLVALTAAIAVPIGVGAAVYLEEYNRQDRLAQFIELNIANLAGVPSIIYGLLGLEIFVRAMRMGSSLLAGAATLALLILPIVVVSAREALRTVPDSLREGAFALGASRLRVITRVVLPIALPGILTGSILAVSRAMGETAPLIVVGALTYMAFLPTGVLSPFTALPIQIFNWTSRPQEGFVIDAAAGIVVLMVALMVINGAAIALRNRTQRRDR
ncbi:MAG: phosphate ABC transporter permease PstA [Myxococcota bacterium]